MKKQRLSVETLGKIGKMITDNPEVSNQDLSKMVQDELKIKYCVDAVRAKRNRMGQKSPEILCAPMEKEERVEKKLKSSFEVHDGYVYNSTTKTVITDLGEYGSFVCSLDMHKAIQRAYVDSYEGKGDTASQVAMRFDFTHAKAVYKYAKIHGFTKSSVPQTDLEFKEGLTPDEAVAENVQAMKRKTYKLTEQAKWKYQQDSAEKWNNFHHSVLKSLENHLEEYLPKHNPPVLVLTKSKQKYAVVMGISDLHYMKFCHDHLGKPTYNREIAIKRLQEALTTMIGQITRHGVPETIFLPVGSDNLHVDNAQHTTTKFTNQVGATDGHWALELKNYVSLTLNMIDMLSQVAPLVLIPTAGNHDKSTSFMLNAYLSIHYATSKRVKFTECYDSRVYAQYGNQGFIFGHFEDMSEKKIQSNAHKFIMAEAKDRGITADRFSIFSQHLHTDSFKALGGGVQHYILPSLSGTDQWHRDNAYIGQSEASCYIFDKEKGKTAIFYA